MKTLTLLFFATLAIAQTPHQQDSTTGRTGSVQDFSGSKGKPPETVVGSLPTAASNTNFVYLVTDGASASDCTTGSGTTRVWCTSNGATWVAVGGAGGGGGLGSAVCSSPSVGGGAVAPAFTSTSNCAAFSISSATTVTPTFPATSAGPFYYVVTNTTPTASPLTYAGTTATGVCQPDASSASAITVITMMLDGSILYPAACSSATATPAANGSVLCSHYATGPPIPCVTGAAGNLLISGGSGTLGTGIATDTNTAHALCGGSPPAFGTSCVPSGSSSSTPPYLTIGSNVFITDLNMMQPTVPTGTYTWTAFNTGSVTNSNGARVLDVANSNGDQWRGETTPVGTGASFAAAFSFVGQNTYAINHGVACGMGAFDGTNYFGIFISYLSGGTNIPPVIFGAHVTSVTANIGTVDYDSSVTATPGKTNIFKISASALSGPWTLQVGDGQGHWSTFATAKDFGGVTGTATKWWYGCDNNSAQATANAGDLFLTLKDAEVAP